jgi:DNA-binding IscR family transcriptional regulator
LAEEDPFVLGRDPATIGIKEILDSIRGGSDGNMQAKKEDDERLIDELLLDVDQAMRLSLQGKTLQDLVLSLEAPRRDVTSPNEPETTA